MSRNPISFASLPKSRVKIQMSQPFRDIVIFLSKVVTLLWHPVTTFDAKVTTFRTKVVTFREKVVTEIFRSVIFISHENLQDSGRFIHTIFSRCGLYQILGITLLRGLNPLVRYLDGVKLLKRPEPSKKLNWYRAISPRFGSRSFFRTWNRSKWIFETIQNKLRSFPGGARGALGVPFPPLAGHSTS